MTLSGAGGDRTLFQEAFMMAENLSGQLLIYVANDMDIEWP